jgi:predicted Zn-ribbon and HTH transcriptional regulator
MALTMGRRRTPLSFEPPRSRLGSREEVRVGAYARRQRRRRILIGLFGALLIAGACGLYHQLRPPGDANAGDRYRVRIRCTACGYTATVAVPFDQTFPMKCPACNETACQEVWRCLDCGAEFVPEHVGTVVRCPKCNSLRVGSAAAP